MRGLALAALAAGAGSCPALAHPEGLCSEVAELRAALPAYVWSLGEPYEAREAVTARRKLRTRKATQVASPACAAKANAAKGLPWKLAVDLAGPETAPPAYRRPLRVVLSFRDWPAQRPDVLFASALLGPYTTPSGKHWAAPSPALERHLVQLHSEGCPAVRALLDLLHASLGGPLDAADKELWAKKAAPRHFQPLAARYALVGPLDPQLFGRRPALGLDPGLVEALGAAKALPRAAARRALLGGPVEELSPGVYAFRVLSDDICAKLLAELAHFGTTKLTASKSNSMHTYGVTLTDLGLEPFVRALQDEVVQPLAAVLLPEYGQELEGLHAFSVTYTPQAATHLDMHNDGSDVTLNVNLGGNHEQSRLLFCGLHGERDHRQFRLAVRHRPGYAVLHVGKHRHGAEVITRGERTNLVLWSYSHNRHVTQERHERYAPEDAAPDAECVSYTHDRDYGQFKDRPAGLRPSTFAPWCPPRGFEYDGFVPDQSRL